MKSGYERRCHGCRLPESQWVGSKFGVRIPGWCGKCMDRQVMANAARRAKK